MKKIALILSFFAFAFTSFSQTFSDTVELNQYIRDTIKDRRPAQISANQVQKALLGLSHFLNTSVTDVSGLHKAALLNIDGTKIIFYNSAGDSVGNVILPHTDIYQGSNITLTDTLGGTAIVISSTGGSGGTTDEQNQTAGESTTLTFTDIPSDYKDYDVIVNGATLTSIDHYTTVGNDITIPGLKPEYEVLVKRKK